MSTTLARTLGPCPTPDGLSDECARWVASWLGDAANHPLFRMEVTGPTGWTVHPFADPDGHMPAAHVAEALALMAPRTTVLRTGQSITATGPAPHEHVRIRWTAVPDARPYVPGEQVDWAATFTGDGWESALIVQRERHAWQPFPDLARAHVIQKLLSGTCCCPDGATATVDAAGVIKVYAADGGILRLTPHA
ncbi:hypothetical protein [Streptacidiphilus jiangxiensis]|uniref:Uncharacterized protein n=1 Tax=Streptacidiphilus jiangxiensis TaxID=235985 RepID=A0A1H8AHT4_STRJI|nr:hypothetical protein [Streptacidiphilus jiangxiensis]SEM70362.1 hypothetical protein SAMN05414137_14532 [Streptacidiphilus jiangxiensis]